MVRDGAGCRILGNEWQRLAVGVWILIDVEKVKSDVEYVGTTKVTRQQSPSFGVQNAMHRRNSVGGHIIRHPFLFAYFLFPFHLLFSSHNFLLFIY